MAANGPRQRLDPQQFRTLPEPVDLDATVTSQDTVEVAPELFAQLREDAWMLRHCG